MPVYLITGDVGSGKTGRVLECLSPHIKKRTGLIVTPSDAQAFGLRRRLIQEHGALLGDAVLPYNLFIKNLASPVMPLMSRTEQILLLYRLTEEADLKYFKSASVGTARQAAETITALKKNFVGPKSLKQILTGKPGKREEDFIRLFELYENEKLKLGLTDEGDLTTAAAQNTEENKQGILTNLTCMAFDEFISFSPGQMKLIGIIVKRLPHLELFISFPDVSDEKELFYPYIRKNLSTLKKISSEEIKMPAAAGRKIKPESYALRSPAQETLFITQEIVKTLNGKTGPEKISVMTRQNDPWLMDFLRELESRGLASSNHQLGTPLSSPVMHELFLRMPAILPESARAEEFREAVKDEIKKRSDKMSIDCGDKLQARNAINSYSVGQILDSFAHAAGTLKLGKVPRETFLSLILSDCLSFFVSTGSLAGACPLNILNFEDGPSFPAEVVFIPRAVEGTYPAFFHERMFFINEAGSDTGILSEIFPGPDETLARESFLFNRIMLKAKRVVITHSVIDGNGKETAASSFLDEMGEPEPVEIPAAPRREISTPAFIRHLELVTQIEEERELGIAAHPAYHGKLQDKNVRKRIKERFTGEPLSPSDIETYAECPFRFFVERVLNLAPPEEITPEIQPQDLGSIVHAVLERFYRQNIDTFRKAVSEKKLEKNLLQSMDQIVDEIFNEKEKKISYSAKGLRPHAKETVKMMTKQAVRKELEMVRALPRPLLPVECEWEFGKTPDTVLELETGGVSPALIRGRVDRIDASPDNSCFAVVDYKTGRNVTSVVGKMKKGLHLQLPLYVEAVRKLKLPKSTALGGVILSVYRGEKKHGFLKKSFNDVHYSLSSRLASVLDDDKWEEVLRDALTATAKHVLAIRESNFEIKPADCRSYCSYEDICRYNKKRADDVPEKGD